MKLRYRFSEIGKSSIKSREEAIKSTDEAAKAMGDLINIVGKASGSRVITWFLAHCYTRRITSEHIEYHFYLLDWITKFTKVKGKDE